MKKLAYLDGLRGLAAWTVMLGHCAQWTLLSVRSANPNRHYGDHLVLMFTFLSGLCVPAFIVLSGYCLALPAVNSCTLAGGAREFLSRRARRILPAYYAALVGSVVVAVFVTHDLDVWQIFSPEVFWPALLLHDVFPVGVLFNRPIWSLAIEWHCYFALPIVVWAAGRWGWGRSLLTACALSTAAIYLIAGTRFAGLQPQYYLLFFAGILAAWVARSVHPLAEALRGLSLWRTGPVILCAVFAGVALVMSSGQEDSQPLLYPLAAGLGAVVLILSLAAPGRSRIRELLESAPLERIGAVSYSLYLWHFPVLLLALFWLKDPLGHLPALAFFLLLCVVVAPCSLAAASVSYALFERPYLRRRETASSPSQRPQRYMANSSAFSAAISPVAVPPTEAG